MATAIAARPSQHHRLSRRGIGCAAQPSASSSRCPVVVKTGAMFHPQPLVAFLATLAMVLAARMLSARRYGLGAAVVLGVVVGAGQLVRSVGIWTLGVVCLALLVAAIARRGERRAALRATVVVGVVGVLVALPWYVYLHTRYSNPIFGRSSAPSSTVVEPRDRPRALRGPLTVSTPRGGTASVTEPPLLRRSGAA